jgi:transposase-like protein
MDETSSTGQGVWHSVDRAVEKQGQTMDVRLTAQRDEAAALRVLKNAIRRHGVPEKSPSDGSAANEAALKSEKAEHGTAIVLRTTKYLKNIVEQDHCAVTRVTRPMVGCKAFDAAQGTLAGIERMQRIKKQQRVGGAKTRTSLRPKSSTPWPRQPSIDKGNLPFHTPLSKICDKAGGTTH